MTEEYKPYEGAGFFLKYNQNVLLGRRLKKNEDIKKDPTEEFEYFGGKVEESDLNDPFNTAYSELTEELGMDILSSDWKNRVKQVHIYQPFSKKWIWCFVLDLTSDEYIKIVLADYQLDNWNDNVTKIFNNTSRKTPTRKALHCIVAVNNKDFIEYIINFNLTTKTNNRMKDAKEYGNNNMLTGTRISNQSIVYKYPLRGFNTVMFENNINLLK